MTGPRDRRLHQGLSGLLLLGLLVLSACADQVIVRSDTGIRCARGSVWVPPYTTSTGTVVPGYCRGGTVVVFSSNFEGRVPSALEAELPGAWELEEEFGEEPMPILLTLGDRNDGLDLLADGVWWPELALEVTPEAVDSRWTEDGAQVLTQAGDRSIEIRLELETYGGLRVAVTTAGREAESYGLYQRRANGR